METYKTNATNGKINWQKLLENAPFAGAIIVIWVVFVQPMQGEMKAIKESVTLIREEQIRSGHHTDSINEIKKRVDRMEEQIYELKLKVQPAAAGK